MRNNNTNTEAKTMTTLQDRTDSKLTYSRTASNGKEINIYITDTTNWISQDIQKELEAEGIRSANLGDAAFYTSLRGAKTAISAMLRARGGQGIGMVIKDNESIMLGHLSNDQWQVVWVEGK